MSPEASSEAANSDNTAEQPSADASEEIGRYRLQGSNDPAGPAATADARGLKCPLPVVRAMQRMADIAPGSLLLVKTTDPEAPVDMAAWCGDAGHELVSQSAVADGHEFLIRKAGA